MKCPRCHGSAFFEGGPCLYEGCHAGEVACCTPDHIPDEAEIKDDPEAVNARLFRNVRENDNDLPDNPAERGAGTGS